MDDARFWTLIAAVDVDLLKAGDEARAVEPLRSALEDCPPGEIEAFEEHLALKLFALDGRAFATSAGDSSGSDDAFLYARCFVVALGRRHYESVLADPAKMPKTIDEWCEALLGVASEAFESSTGEEWQFEASVSYETGSNGTLWN